METKKRGFLQALGVTIYCSLIGIFFWKGNEIFGKINNYFGPVAFLLMFSVSVLICALIVFYKPYKLFFDGKKKEAIDIVLYTTTGLFIFFLLSLLLMILFK
jgi:hypothetical protein